jgi:hypothetical protein
MRLSARSAKLGTPPGLGAGREEKLMITETQKILKRLETLLSDPCV